MVYLNTSGKDWQLAAIPKIYICSVFKQLRHLNTGPVFNWHQKQTQFICHSNFRHFGLDFEYLYGWYHSLARSCPNENQTKNNWQPGPFCISIIFLFGIQALAALLTGVERDVSTWDPKCRLFNIRLSKSKPLNVQTFYII